MTARELDLYLKTLGPVPAETVDRVVVGDPETVVVKVGVCWLPYWDTCREAVRRGVNVLVVHEPTFYAHWDGEGSGPYVETIAAKRRWLNEAGLVIIRCHDMLDRATADYGVPFAFGRALGFAAADLIRSAPFYHVYRCPKMPAGELARRLAARLASVGQAGVGFYGDPQRTVRSVGVGTGMICNPADFASMAPDASIVINDAIRTWEQPAFARDTGQPLIVVDHGTSEEFGVKALQEHLAAQFPALEVLHFPQGVTYEWITSSAQP